MFGCLDEQLLLNWEQNTGLAVKEHQTAIQALSEITFWPPAIVTTCDATRKGVLSISRFSNSCI